MINSEYMLLEARRISVLEYSRKTLVTEKNAQNKNCMKSLVIILTRNHATFDDKYSLDA